MKRQILKARTFQERTSIIDAIFNIPETEKIKVEISSIRDIRTVSQNKLYWLWMACLEHETGTHSTFYHEYFKDKYLPKESAIIRGKVVSVTPSTTSENTKQFTQYLENVRIDAEADFGITLPDPKEKAWEQFYLQYRDRI